NLEVPIPRGNRLELFAGTFIGAVTFSGSIIAFGKLAGLGTYSRLFSRAPVVFKAQHIVNLLIHLTMVGARIVFVGSAPEGRWQLFVAMTATAFVVEVLIIIRNDVGDMAFV